MPIFINATKSDQGEVALLNLDPVTDVKFVPATKDAAAKLHVFRGRDVMTFVGADAGRIYLVIAKHIQR